MRSRFFKHGLIGLIMLPVTAIYGPGVNAAEEDPHAHHRHMVMTDGYTKSVQAYQLPDVTLIDEHGTVRPLTSMLDQSPVIVNFIFTSCTAICPIMSTTFAQLQEKLDLVDKNIRLISISIDPEEDTPAKLRQYADKFRADDRWHFLTGDKSDIISVQQGFDAYRGSKMNHVPLTYIRVRPDAPWIRINGFATASVIVNEYQQAAKPISTN